MSQEFSLIQQVYRARLKSLFYEARARLEHPIYGSAGYVYSLQRQIVKVNEHLFNAKKELASYIGEEHAGLPSYIPPIRLQKQLNPSSSFPSPPLLKSAPHAAVKFGIDQSPADHCLNINSGHRRDSTKRKREDILVRGVNHFHGGVEYAKALVIVQTPDDGWSLWPGVSSTKPWWVF
ncbi:hypothetical protein NC651_018010 [Populus alba x Populus x berolinensis]|nr:hypothetical protein NC651_018010 [Populus alba x Populus x berolinensis]